jgi:hypothetical protein
VAKVGCCIPATDDDVDKSVARPDCCIAETVDVGEEVIEDVAEFITAAAAAAAAWAAAAGVVALGKGEAEAAGISITGKNIDPECQEIDLTSSSTYDDFDFFWKAQYYKGTLHQSNILVRSAYYMGTNNILNTNLVYIFFC